VQVSPASGEHELVGRRTVLVNASGTDRAQQLGGVEVLDPTCSGSHQRLDHVFDSNDSHRQQPVVMSQDIGEGSASGHR